MKDSFTSEIDQIDVKILRLLQQDGRLSNAELAERVNVSAATCHRRVRRLVKEGYICGFRANMDPERVELGTIALGGVVPDRSTPESFAESESLLKQLL